MHTSNAETEEPKSLREVAVRLVLDLIFLLGFLAVITLPALVA